MRRRSATGPSCSIRATSNCPTGCSISRRSRRSWSIRNRAESAYAEGAILRRAILRARRSFCGEEARPPSTSRSTRRCPIGCPSWSRSSRTRWAPSTRPTAAVFYQHLVNRVESVSSDKRYDFMFSSFSVRDNMRQILSRMLRIPVEGKPITIIDISGVPSEIVDVVVSVLCRLIFEFALWSDREQAPPILLVCEEAHRYVPRDDQAGFAPTRRSISRIAKEGRKYGLVVVPGDPAPGRAVGQQPVAVQHDFRAAARQRARPRVRPPRRARQLALARRRAARAQHPGGAGAGRRRAGAAPHPLPRSCRPRIARPAPRRRSPPPGKRILRTTA